MYSNIIFYFLFCLTFLSCFFLISGKNRIYSILHLISIYMNISILMMYLGMSIVGLFYFLVYIGAITVLFLFSVMILDYKEKVYARDYGVYIGLFSFALLLFFFFYFFFFDFLYSYSFISFEYMFSTFELLKILGILMFMKYSFTIILVGVLLLISMIGSIYLTNFKKGFYIKKQSYVLSRSAELYYCFIY